MRTHHRMYDLFILINLKPFGVWVNRDCIMKTVEMSLAEFINWEILAFKHPWTYKVVHGLVLVTAPINILNSLGYDE